MFKGQLYLGTDGVLGVRGGGFLLGPTFWLGFWFLRRFRLDGANIDGYAPQGRVSMKVMAQRVSKNAQMSRICTPEDINVD